MAKRKRLSNQAKACVSHEITKHCRKKPGKCHKPLARKQAIAIGFSVCKRKGFKVPRKPR